MGREGTPPTQEGSRARLARDTLTPPLGTLLAPLVTLDAPSLRETLGHCTLDLEFVVPFSFVSCSPSVKRGAQVRPDVKFPVNQCWVRVVPRASLPMGSMGYMGRRRRRERAATPRPMVGRAVAQLPAPSVTRTRGQPLSGREDNTHAAHPTSPDGPLCLTICLSLLSPLFAPAPVGPTCALLGHPSPLVVM